MIVILQFDSLITIFDTRIILRKKKKNEIEKRKNLTTSDCIAVETRRRCKNLKLHRNKNRFHNMILKVWRESYLSGGCYMKKKRWY